MLQTHWANFWMRERIVFFLLLTETYQTATKELLIAPGVHELDQCVRK